MLVNNENRKMALRRTLRLAGAIFPLCMALAACNSAPAPPAAPAADVLASLGSERLTAADVRAAMPAGLSADDSARFVRAFVNSWVDAHLVTDVASSQVDMEQIERMTADYRSQLIMQEYTRKMFETHAAGIPDDSLRAYYDAHRSEFILDRPMVHGIYLKLPSDTRNLRTIRRLFRSDRPDDIDRLEKEILASAAIHYDYFRDRWVDWEQIEARVPVEFGSDPGAWLARGDRTIDHTAGPVTYLLRITDVLPAHSPMPFEAAREQITRRLLASGRRAYQTRLLRELRDSAMAAGTLFIAE